MKGKRSMRYRKKGFRKTRKQRAGFMDKLFGSSQPTQPAQPVIDNDPNQDKKQYGSLTSAVTGSVKASSKAWNMPAAIAAMTSKLNALLIHNKVNYKFSNGYNARDYTLADVSGSGDNDGRGVLLPGAKRNVITGFQSKIYNKGSDVYDASKKGKAAQQQPQQNNQY